MGGLHITDVFNFLDFSDTSDHKDRYLLSLPFIFLYIMEHEGKVREQDLYKHLSAIFGIAYASVIAGLLKQRGDLCRYTQNKFELLPEANSLIESYKYKKEKFKQRITDLLREWHIHDDITTDTDLINKFSSFLIAPFQEIGVRIDFRGYTILTDLEKTDFVRTLNLIYSDKKDEMEDVSCLLYGIANIYSYKLSTSSIEPHSEVLYIDDTFLINLFGWQPSWYAEPARHIFETLRTCNARIKIYDITINILMHTIKKFQDSDKNRILVYSLYDYMENASNHRPSNNDKKQNPYEIGYIETLTNIIAALGIEVETFERSISVNPSSKLYQDIQSIRQGKKLEKSELSFINQTSYDTDYDEYHYKIITYFNRVSDNFTRYLTFKSSLVLKPYKMNNKAVENRRIAPISEVTTYFTHFFVQNLLRNKNINIKVLKQSFMDLLEIFYGDATIPEEIRNNIEETIKEIPGDEQDILLDGCLNDPKERELLYKVKGNMKQYYQERQQLISQKDTQIDELEKNKREFHKNRDNILQKIELEKRKLKEVEGEISKFPNICENPAYGINYKYKNICLKASWGALLAGAIFGFLYALTFFNGSLPNGEFFGWVSGGMFSLLCVSGPCYFFYNTKCKELEASHSAQKAELERQRDGLKKDLDALNETLAKISKEY